MKYSYKKLFRIAFIAAPIMGLSDIILVFLRPDKSILEVFKIFLVVTAIIMLLWLINICILKLMGDKSNNLRIATSIVLSFIFLLIFSMIFAGQKPMEHNFSNVNPLPIKPIGRHLFPRNFIPVFSGISKNLIILFIIELMISREREKKITDENTQLKIKNLEAKQLQLKQQIQPHFLFNSLNTLKSMITEYPQEAEQYLVKLSSLLRYHLNVHTSDLILLKDELKICTDYLDIQKVRFKNSLRYIIDVNDKSASNATLPSFAIQLLAENAIKHNVFTEETPLFIEIKSNSKNEIIVSNNIQKRNHTTDSLKVGLKNLSERYRLLLKKDIKIIETNGTFEITLPLKMEA